VALEPEDQRIASASWDGTVRLWGEATAGRSPTIPRLDGIATAVVFSPDGLRLGTFDGARSVFVWEPPFSKPL
jgi:WD40 repeat protein